MELRVCMHNNFLVQIVRSLSEKGRVFLRRKNYCFDFNRLLLFVWVRTCRSYYLPRIAATCCVALHGFPFLDTAGWEV